VRKSGAAGRRRARRDGGGLRGALVHEELPEVEETARTGVGGDDVV
jgi:hypothetical protein